MSFIYSIITGLIVGLLARTIKPGKDAMGWIMTIILGLAGGAVGGLLASILGLSANGTLGNIVLSVVGALILLFGYDMVTKKRP